MNGFLPARCIQPTQQHGRRMPFLSILSCMTTKCLSRVSCLATVVTQQIHSLRARGVMSSHIASNALLDEIIFFMSAGNLCSTPPEISFVNILLFYFKYADIQ